MKEPLLGQLTVLNQTYKEMDKAYHKYVWPMVPST